MVMRYTGRRTMRKDPQDKDRVNDPGANAMPPSPADATRGTWVNRAPAAIRPYLQLSRFDRPAGFWLLGLPCAIGLSLARVDSGIGAHDAVLLLLFAIGAIAMRGAGCTYNDILDRRIDAQVARTALRPLPAGAVSLKQAWAWLLIQCLIGLGVLLCLPRLAQYVALGSIPLVALYPLMKRITWWPQVWLGLTFNWGALVAAAAIRGTFVLPDFVLYAALIFWTLGYDTIYALQDREDDALIGVKSTARRFGSKVKPAVALIYLICSILAAAAGWLAHGWIGAVVTLPFALHLAQQAYRLVPDDGRLALELFKANREAGLLLFAGWAFIAAFI
jgi:4-hydroxybenzoate polyprenyltransferase